eukprot:scaffold53008_cov32-Tisochrysis_lutea.AAC.6
MATEKRVPQWRKIICLKANHDGWCALRRRPCASSADANLSGKKRRAVNSWASYSVPALRVSREDKAPHGEGESCPANAASKGRLQSWRPHSGVALVGDGKGALASHCARQWEWQA